MKKILITYASAGDGHKAAAEAVYNAFLESKNDDIRPTLIDSLHYATRLFKYLYRAGYIVMIKYIPTLWGLLYYMLDNRFFFMLNAPFRRAINALNTKRLTRLLIEENYDVVISTHFLATEVISHLKRKDILSVPLVTIITDFQPHRFWEAKGVDYYVVAGERTKDMLKSRGVSETSIKVFGIPTHRRFKRLLSKEEARQKLRLNLSKFTILVMGGGFGVGPIEQVVLKLQEVNFDCQIIAVCGHNRRLFNKLNLLKSRFAKPTSIFGFCLNMGEIMTAADIIVTKVGGMAVSEALVKALPVVFIKPIPGQEARNADFLLKNNVGFKTKGINDIGREVERLFHAPEKIRQVKDDMQDLAKPHAAEEIVRLAMEIIDRRSTLSPTGRG